MRSDFKKQEKINFSKKQTVKTVTQRTLLYYCLFELMFYRKSLNWKKSIVSAQTKIETVTLKLPLNFVSNNNGDKDVTSALV